MTDQSHELRRLAEAYYTVANDIDRSLAKTTEMRDLLNRFGDEYSEQASVAADREKANAK
jgi:hypothetical protein